MLIRELAQRLQEGPARKPDAALALDRLDENACGFLGDGGFRRFEVAERNLVEALDLRAEAGHVFRLIARGDRRQRAAVERAFEGENAVALGIAAMAMIFPRHLDGCLHRLRAGVGEEHLVGECRAAKPFGKPFLARHAIKIRSVPELARLLGQRRNEMRMGMAQDVNGHAGGEVEIAVAGSCEEPRAFSAIEFDVEACIGS